MKKLNWTIIIYNIAEAREQLEEIETRASGKPPLSEGELQVMLEHAYHHLNFAWNIRRVPTRTYAHLTDEQFNRWSRYPADIEESAL